MQKVGRGSLRLFSGLDGGGVNPALGLQYVAKSNTVTQRLKNFEGQVMGILEQIQQDLADAKDIGPILLKLRLLTAKLGSKPLEEWVRHETEGYPASYPLPEYRVLAMSFIGHFSGPFGAHIKNAPIPPYLVRVHCGEKWEHYRVISSAASIDSLLKGSNGVHLDLSNLALLLEGKIYPNYACNQVVGYVSHSAILEVSQAIRSRLLELTIQIENEIPSAKDIQLSQVQKNSDVATQIFHQTIYGSMNNSNNGNIVSTNTTQVMQGSVDALIKALTTAGLSQKNAQEISEVIASEAPEVDGFSPRMRKWVAERLTKGIDVGVSGGVPALIALLAKAAKDYWGG
jgi:hypothetical protein